MFDHVQIKVSDYKKSRPFYEAVLGALGYNVVIEFNGVVGIGTNPHDMLEIRQADEEALLSASCHVALRAKSENDVRKFHETALALGATDNGAPGLRTDVEPGYFAAFVTDPNGHNLEAVFQKES